MDVLLDANVLLLFVVGNMRPDLISRFKRTSNQFDESHYWTLIGYLAKFRRKLTTPHILSEVNSLLGQLDGGFREEALAFVHEAIDMLDEDCVASRIASNQREYGFLGLTDATIFVAARNQLTSSTGASLEILTTDAALRNHLVRGGWNAVNFHHLCSAE